MEWESAQDQVSLNGWNRKGRIRERSRSPWSVGTWVHMEGDKGVEELEEGTEGSQL